MILSVITPTSNGPSSPAVRRASLPSASTDDHVIYELDIWRATNLLICGHGAEAELHAAQRVSGAPAADGARCAAKNSCTLASASRAAASLYSIQ